MGKPFTHAPASDTAAVITIPAVVGQRIKLASLVFSYTADPTGGVLTIESPSGTVKHTEYVTNKGVGPVLFDGSDAGCWEAPEKNTAVVIRLTAGGTGISGAINCLQVQ